MPFDCITQIPFVGLNSFRGLEAPFGAVHVDDVGSHSAGDLLEGPQEVARKKLGPRGSSKCTDLILERALTMEITGSAVEGEGKEMAAYRQNS